MDRRRLCRRCGFELAEDVQRCPQCGEVVEGATPPPPPPACPRCGKDVETPSQVVGRLSALPDDHDASVESEDDYFRRQALLLQLARPEEPRPFSLTAWVAVLLFPVVNVLSLFFAPLTVGLRLFIGALALFFVVAVVRYAGGDFADPFAARDAAMMVGMTTFTLYLVALVQSWFAARREVRTTLAPAYTRRLERWDRMAYCAPCNVAFLDDGTEVDLEAEWATTEPRRNARTPIWLWALLAAGAVWGVGGALRTAPWDGSLSEPVEEGPPASPELWEDIQSDPVTPPPEADPGEGLDRSLLSPPPEAGDTTGG